MISPQERHPSFNQLTFEIRQHSDVLAGTPDKTSAAHLSHLCMQAKAGERNYEVIPPPTSSASSH